MGKIEFTASFFPMNPFSGKKFSDTLAPTMGRRKEKGLASGETKLS